MIIIYGIKEQLNPIKQQLSNVIHSCMKIIFGLPEDKRAQRFIPMDSEDFFMPSWRSNRYTVIEINMIEGRTIETKKKRA